MNNHGIWLSSANWTLKPTLPRPFLVAPLPPPRASPAQYDAPGVEDAAQWARELSAHKPRLHTGSRLTIG